MASVILSIISFVKSKMGVVLEEDLQPNVIKKSKSPVEFYDHLTNLLVIFF